MEPNRQPAPLATILTKACHGIITLEEARLWGISRDAVGRLVRRGTLQRLWRGVYSIGVPSRLGLIVAAVRWADPAVASHQTAAEMWRLDGIPADATIHIAATTRRRTEGVVVHRAAALDGFNTAVVRNVPVTSPTRTLFDLASVVDESSLQLATEDALRRGLTSTARLTWAVSAQGGQGHPGTRVFRKVLSSLEGRRATDSPLEARFLQQIRAAGLPLPVPQYEIRSNGKFVARVDFAYPDRRIAIEIDGYRWHSGGEAWARDHARYRQLTLLGWTPVPITHDDIAGRTVAPLVANVLGVRTIF